MSGNGRLSPAQVHAKLKHPIVDGDGHWVEFPPVFAEKMRKVGGDKAADGFLAPRGAGDALKMTRGERTERRIAQPNFWNRQGENTLDRATAMMPKLLYERLDEIGTATCRVGRLFASSEDTGGMTSLSTRTPSQSKITNSGRLIIPAL